LRCPHCFNYLSSSIEELSQSYNQRLRTSEDIENWMVQNNDDDDELGNTETMENQIGIDIELKKKIFGKLYLVSWSNLFLVSTQ
jgi:hypothetical protein